MRLRSARDLPEARARLLSDLAGTGPLGWTGVDYPPGIARHPVDYAHWLIDWIRSAPLWWVDDHLSGLARSAGASLPEMSITPELAPRSTGLLVWQTPLSARPALGGALTLRCCAVAWTPLDQGLWLELMDTAEGAAALPAQARSLLSSPLLPWKGVLLPWRPRLALASGWGTPEAEAVLSTVATMLLATQPGIAEHSIQAPAPRERRRLARQGHPTDPVTVIRPRPTRDRTDTSASAPSGVHRSHRWLVSGHWRNQPYGPGRSLRRPTWIAPHIAGPAGAPFTDRVTLLDERSLRTPHTDPPPQ